MALAAEGERQQASSRLDNAIRVSEGLADLVL
jgi:hypothetical protein